MSSGKTYEVIIIGGSYSGLSAALTLARSNREILVIDSQSPCNSPTPHSHNFLTRDGVAPSVISHIAREEVMNYPTVSRIKATAVDAHKTENSFSITTQDNQLYKSKKLLLETGIKDLLPPIKGLRECWGKSVIHCPYCHGYEFLGKKTGIMSNAERAMHLAPLILNLTTQLTLIINDSHELSEQQRYALHENDIKWIDLPIEEIIHQDGYIQSVNFQHSYQENFDALYASVPFEQHSHIPAKLGCELTEHGYIKIDHLHRTSVQGVYASGDNSSGMRSVANAVYTGNMAGAMINKELAEERFYRITIQSTMG